MKKTTTLALFLSLTSLAYAQEIQNDKATHLGVKIGLNLSNVYDSDGEEFIADSKVGFALGAFLTIPIDKTIAIQPEILISQKGFTSTGRILGSTYELKRTSTFVDVPLLIAIRPAPFLSILAGPQYSYLVKQTNVFENGTTSILQEQEFENDNIRKNILGISGGIDINIDALVFSARAGWDIQKNRGDGTSSTPQYKNAWYQATVGFRFL